jgi:acyl transferase domain-containing protein/thioesterase domain-containing protein/NAD(P)-dependent dehydrogenase (short-subunit alcohol dehydrogenase family)/acyl carrier protein
MGNYNVSEDSLDSADVAVVGLSVRLPGANDAREFWTNLRGGVESIQRLSDEDLVRAGEDSAALHDPNYVRAAATLDRLELFDAGFFGFSKREASVLDPQHRHFLEVCYEALEDAGIVPAAFPGAIGVFAGSGMNSYMPYNLFTNPELMRSMGLFLVRHTGNDKDFLTTRVSYCLNLKGPSVNVQTACSTSLVAIHQACQSLLAGECDIALAGGVTIELPHGRGYHYEEGEILSPDGHCRPFEARSKGTVFGSGAGVVVLRRLRDAVENGDSIRAIVKGSAVNNDGNRKVGYLAPSVEGQAECVVEALEVAGLGARQISYIECHGTGTPVGDPIEMAALLQAFSRSTTDRAFCGVGSVKSNIGHLDTAAGIASFVKVVHMLEHEELAPTLHFEKPNPQIDFPATPFFVVGQNRRWPRADAPRRAGVSSLGVGGTNAHVIVEEAPRREKASEKSRGLVVLSARSQASLDRHAAALSRHLEAHPELELSEVSSTLLYGRKRFPFARVLAAASTGEAVALLRAPDATRVFDVRAEAEELPVVFLFPGGGAQHANMARDVYESEPVFRAAVDECLAILKKRENLELRALMFPAAGEEEAASRELERPSLALPALLTIELAFARLLDSWGIRPSAMIGHSLGEYAAAHLAGVLSLESALGILCCRGRLFEKVKKGGMLSVALPREKVEPLLANGLSIAAVNAPELCVVSGENAELDALERRLGAEDVQVRRLHIDVPAHSPLLEPILAEFREYLASVPLAAPKLPYVSNLTGAFVAEKDLSREYFVRHLRNTVRFSEGLAAVLAAHPAAVLVELGPGQTLTSLARLQPARTPRHAAVPLSPHVKDPTPHDVFLSTSIGRIWAHGGALNLEAFAGARRIVPLPATPFEHERHWIEPGTGYFMARAASEESEREADVGRWFFTSTFREEPRGPAADLGGESWLVLAEGPLERALSNELRARGVRAVLVTPGERSAKLAPDRYSLALGDPEGYADVLQRVAADGAFPKRIVHALCLSPSLLDPEAKPNAAALERAFFSLLYLAQALGQEELAPGTELLVAVSRASDVAGTTTLRPLHALTRGPVLVVPRELSDVRARSFDLLDVDDSEAAARAIVDELAAPSNHAVVAERARVRYVGGLDRVALETEREPKLPERPVVLLTGGLGGIARTLAAHLASEHGARLALFTRSDFGDAGARKRLRAELDPRDGRIEQLDALAALEARGVEVMLERVDVASAADVVRAVAGVRARFGRIDLVVHAAGILDDGPLALKERGAAEAVLEPKVAGAQNLVDALADDPPSHFVLLSSTSAALGPPGQIDYVAANAFVSALAHRVRHAAARTHVVSLGFGVWRDTGMAARAVGPFTARIDGEATGHPLLERARHVDGRLELESLIEPSRLWVLDEHRVRGGGPVLPGTAMLEIVRAAGARVLASGAPGALEVRDVFLVSPLQVPDGERRLCHVEARREEGSDVASVSLRSRGRDDRGDVEHATGTVSMTVPPAPARLAIAEIQARCTTSSATFEEGEHVLPQDRYLAFGPRWRVIREMHFGKSEAIARLELPARFASELGEFGLHPGVLDMASGFAFSLADGAGDADQLRVPLSYQMVRIHAPLEREITSHVRLRERSDDGVGVFDVTLADTEGRVLVEIEGYTTKAVAPATLGAARQPAREPSLLERWSRQGIRADEGVAVLERVLATAAPAEVYATPVSLYTMLEALAPKRAQEDAARPARASDGATDSSADAPRDDIERRLAEMWCSLLGVESVGIRQNFFELGGHSLIAVRLFARIKKAYGVDLPLAVLFQAPTIEKCAEMLRKSLGIELLAPKSRPNGSSPQAAPAERAFAHVVPIQSGNGGAPFFCVHGAGGNVLNFRALAQHLGSAQPFYGVQARGVGGEEPLTTIDAMADAYLEEIRAARPTGPYLLGGYSGGGVVAYELAQRLRAAGEEVPLLVLLDTFHPATTPRKITMSERMGRLLAEGPRYLSRQGKLKVSRHLGELSTELKMLFYTSNDMPLPLELRNHRLFNAFRDAASKYRPRPYDGAVLLFRARMIDEIYSHMGPALGWRELIPNLEIIEVPGGHDSLVLEPNVQVLTAQLARAIAGVVEKRA